MKCTVNESTCCSPTPDLFRVPTSSLLRDILNICIQTEMGLRHVQESLFQFETSMKPEFGNISRTEMRTRVFSSRPIISRSSDSVVGIAIGYGLDDREVRIPSPSRIKNFLFSTLYRLALGSTQPLIQPVLGALSRRVKQQGHEADHSPPASAQVKKVWSIHPLPHTPSWRSA
jgi:hypothetical protein